MYRKTFYLTQHTPLIHFQHDQAGATLRATEVKARLDRFIREELISHLKNHRELATTVHKFFGTEADSKATAMLYQLHVLVPEENPSYYFFRSGSVKENDKEALEANLSRILHRAVTAVGGTQFFSNEDKLSKNNRAIESENEKNIRLAVMYKGLHELRISSRNTDLLKVITYSVPFFFLSNNFGTRKTKGFGSFTVKDSTAELKDINSCFSAVYTKEFPGNWQQKLQYVSNQYKLLKNKPGTKTESKLRDYFKDKDHPEYWEKILITQKIVKGSDHLVDKDGTRDRTYGYPEVFEEDVKYVRALLGLAELHDYPQQEVKVKIKDMQDGDKAIQRFQSPILFKVTNDRIYLIAKEVPKEMKNRSFGFYVGADYESSTRKATIKTPAHFSIADFLQSKLKGFTYVR